MADVWGGRFGCQNFGCRDSASAAVVAALLSIAGAIFTALYGRSTQKQVELLRGTVAERNASVDALRDYEYDARRRLYTECDPTVFRFLEECEAASNRILVLARLARAPEDADGLSSWIAREDNRIATLYRLVTPVASFNLLRERLTLFDLSLEPRIYFQYQLGKLVLDSFSSDHNLSLLGKPLEYLPGETPQSSQLAVPAIYSRQGISQEHLETIANSLVETFEDRKAIMSFPSFNRARQDSEHPLHDVVLNLDYFLRDFNPLNKPVLWRVLVAQALLYRALSRTMADRTDFRTLSIYLNDDERAALKVGVDADAFVLETEAAALDYVRTRIERAQRLIGFSAEN